MALPPQSHEAFFREVDEEVRRDQMAGFLKRWGKWLAIGLVGFLAAVAAGIGWREYKTAQADREGEAMTAAVDAMVAGKADDAAAKLKPIAQSGIVGYRVGARLSEAGLALAKGDTKGAIAIYGEVAGNEHVPKPYRDLALIRQTAAEYDSLKPQQIIERLKPLAQPASPWLGSAGEMMAIAYIRLDQNDAAGKLLIQIAQDHTVPETIRSRAVQLAGGIGVEIDPEALAKAMQEPSGAQLQAGN